MTQGGLAGFGGVGTNLGWLNYDLEETSDGSFKLTVDNKCEPNRTTEIGLTITIGANGENQITGFEVTIAPKTPN